MAIPCCGPKLSMCGIILSVWGIIMLGLLGVFFRVNAVGLLEDLPVVEKDWEAQKYNMAYIDNLYAQASTNCFIASGMYVAVLAFSVVMWQVNKRSDYTMS